MCLTVCLCWRAVGHPLTGQGAQGRGACMGDAQQRQAGCTARYWSASGPLLQYLAKVQRGDRPGLTRCALLCYALRRPSSA
jgi:hypothetical protein